MRSAGVCLVVAIGLASSVGIGAAVKLAGKAWPWVLGGRMLRAETAVVVGLTAVQLKWGDFAHAPQADARS